MPKSNIIKSLEELDKKDIYSLILFVLYRLKEKEEYSVLSELIYILDNESFVRFLNYFGGQTITVPKIKELRNILNALLFYERQRNSNLSNEEIFKELDIPQNKEEDILRILEVISDTLKDYDFKHDYTI